MRTLLYTHHSIVYIWLVSLMAGIVAVSVLFIAARAHDSSLPLLTGDAKGYAVLASNLLTHGVFSIASQPPYYPESFRSPGYPFFLAVLFVVFNSWTAVLFAQVVLLSVAPVLLYILLRPYHERAAFWGAIMFALEPIHLYLQSTLLSDALFVTLFLASLVLLERGKEEGWYIAAFAGVILGAAILVRPIAMFLPALYVVYLVFPRPNKIQLLAAVASIVGAALVVLPWSLRNWQYFHSFNISSVGAYNLMLYNAPEFLKYRPDIHAQQVYDTFMAQQNILPREEALSLTRSVVFSSTFREIIAGHELQYAFFHTFKTIPFFVSDGLRDTVRLFGVDIGAMPNITTALLHAQISVLWTYMSHGGVASWLLIVGSGFWVLVTLGWLWSCFTLMYQRNWRAFFFTCILVLYFAVLTGPVSNARYRLPAEGFLLVGAVAAVVSLRNYV